MRFLDGGVVVGVVERVLAAVVAARRSGCGGPVFAAPFAGDGGVVVGAVERVFAAVSGARFGGHEPVFAPFAGEGGAEGSEGRSREVEGWGCGGVVGAGEEGRGGEGGAWACEWREECCGQPHCWLGFFLVEVKIVDLQLLMLGLEVR